MVIVIDQMSQTPIYQQIRDQIVKGIAVRDLRPGDALPSVRALAQDLGINLHTVNKAYATLRDEGYVLMLGRKGAFVADAAAEPTAGMDEHELEGHLKRLLTEFVASGGTAEDFVRAAQRTAERA
ncbi:GntR family transcriptional regulator [uncultured Parolsenella sp.]|uniref:GntR family transcriptional regulator n=1 Tax=uncultured Parolsenella sp. TaxID=2083008 RepID=UPI0027D976AF|nr:GntR family transcriptional regulator [uncultured Parolsenella sp.]